MTADKESSKETAVPIYDSIHKTKIIGDDTAQINVHLLGVLIDKAGTILGCIRRIFRFGKIGRASCRERV